MIEMHAVSAFDLPRQLFPHVDFGTAEGRFYEAQNDIAIAVSEYRYEHKLTQSALAEKLGVSQAMVAKYESGAYNISLKAAFELFEKLGMRFSCKIEKEPLANRVVIETPAAFNSTIAKDGNDPFPSSSPDMLIA